MNRKRWLILTAAFVVVLALLTPFGVKAYQDHQETVRINDQFDESFSKVTGYALLAGIEADNIGQKYDDILTNSSASGDRLETMIDQEHTKLIATGKYDKLNDYMIKLLGAYSDFEKKGTKNIKLGAEKKSTAQKVNQTMSEFISLVNKPKPNFDYALDFEKYQKAYLSNNDKCTDLLKQ